MKQDEIIAAILRADPHDFDGHTEFSVMTAEQRLTWLSSAAQFYFLTKIKVARQSVPPRAPSPPRSSRT